MLYLIFNPKDEQKTVLFKVKPANDFRFYNARYRRYMVESSAFQLEIGAASNDIRLKRKVNIE